MAPALWILCPLFCRNFKGLKVNSGVLGAKQSCAREDCRKAFDEALRLPVAIHLRSSSLLPSFVPDLVHCLTHFRTLPLENLCALTSGKTASGGHPQLQRLSLYRSRLVAIKHATVRDPSTAWSLSDCQRICELEVEDYNYEVGSMFAVSCNSPDYSSGTI